MISAVQRTIQAPNSFEIDDVLQTDAPINPGNSGGPLIDATGKVIGINSQIATGGSGSNGSVGIGFAVPIDTAKQIIPDLKQSGRVDRGYLGLDALTVDKALKDIVPVGHGALVQKVAPGGPADKAGIRAGGTQRHARQPPDPAGRRHHHQGRRQGHPHQQRPAGGRRRPHVGRAGQGDLGARRQGQDRRGHPRGAPQRGDGGPAVG